MNIQEFDYPVSIPSWEVEVLPPTYDISPYDRVVGMESWFPHVPDAGYDATITGPDLKDSLWAGLKYVAKTGMEYAKRYLERPLDQNALANRSPLEAVLEEQDRLDGIIATPYPRVTSGSVPAPAIISAGGISPTILLIGAGALAFYFFMRKGK